MAPNIATADHVDREAMLDFIRSRHRLVLVTSKGDGGPQLSPVTGGVDDQGRIVVSSYPERAKVANLRNRPAASVLVLSDDFNGPWLQVDGTAEVIDLPEAMDGLVDYYRSIAGEHDDWDEYRQAMQHQGKVLIRVTPERWGPIATGGFPARLADQ